MTNIVQEEAAHPAQKGTVNCREDSADEGPLRAIIVRNCWVRVVQEREHN